MTVMTPQPLSNQAGASSNPTLITKLARYLCASVLVLAGFGMILALISYNSNGPNILNTTLGPVTNYMGFYGALFANTLILTIGIAAWLLPLAALCYGVRFYGSIGIERCTIRRALFVPLLPLIGALYCATLPTGADWQHSYSMGGFIGDAALAFLVDIAPIEPEIWDRILPIALGLVTALVGLFALGFNLRELWVMCKWVVRLFWRIIAFVFSPQIIWRSKQPATPAPASDIRIKRDLDQTSDPISTEPAQKAPNQKGAIARLFTRREKPMPAPEFNDDLQAEAARKSAAQNQLSARIKESIARRGQRNQAQTAEDGLPMQTQTTPDMNDALPYGKSPDTGASPLMALRPSRNQQSLVKFPSKRAAQSRQSQSEAQPNMFAQTTDGGFTPPSLSMLSAASNITRPQLSYDALKENARMLENVLDDYGVRGEIKEVLPGPVVTMYELEPAPGLKASRVIGLADDIARSMSALSARVSTIPGRNVIGIELPNDDRETVFLREILSTREFGDGKHELPLALGKSIDGKPEIADLSKMPHLLIAGTTGSGKSVAINTMILSLLYKLGPEDCRLIMIDPKMLELSVYDGIPHLLSPVVTDPKKAVVALKWVVSEMEERYRKMSKLGVRNASGYNTRVMDALAKGEEFSRTVQTGFDPNTGEPIFETENFAPEKMPYIVVVVDEMADLMMVAGKEIEACIQRLAQMARASGIHLMMATQRPSVDVITGTIKANFPTRISFQVTSKIDSRTILGEMGAEQLLGMGDMLFMEGSGRITRVHSPFVSDEEVETIVNHLKTFGPPDYVAAVQSAPKDNSGSDIDQLLGLGGNTNKQDALYDQAVAIVAQDRKCSTSYIQRKLSIGYNKAAKLVEEMEENGVISSANHVGKREVLLPDPNNSI